MPTNLRVQHRMNSVSGDPADAIVNTWYFQTDSSPPLPAHMDQIKVALLAFMSAYTTLMSQFVYARDYELKWYNMADPKPRVPIRTDVGNYAVFANLPSLPSQVSVCLSYKGAFESGTRNARRRGRVYLPTVNQNVITQSGQLSTGNVSLIANAAATLLAASDEATTWSWVGFSEADATFYPVIGGWVDNSFDIQRRRQWGGNVRVSFPA